MWLLLLLLLLLLLWCIQTKISLTSNLTAAILSFYAQDFFFFPPPVVWMVHWDPCCRLLIIHELFEYSVAVIEVGWSVDMSAFASQFIDMLSRVSVYPQMVCAIRCLRADGIKTALLTNNFNLSIRRHMSLLDPDLFDVVSIYLLIY